MVKKIQEKKSLTEGTSNFYFEHRCVVITDDDYEFENMPTFENRSLNNSRNFPQYALDDSSYKNDFNFYRIVMCPGYYEAGCIDYTEIDTYDDDPLEIRWDLDNSIDDTFYYEEDDNTWYTTKDTGADEVISEEDVIKMISDFLHKKYASESDSYKIAEEIVGNMKAFSSDSIGDCISSESIETLEEVYKEKEEKEVNEVINKIKSDYGYKEYKVSYRFSNGETGYSEI